MKSNNALIVTWVGSNPSDSVITSIANILLDSGLTIPELLTITHKDESAIAKALLRDSKETIDVVSSEDARTSAVILIGKRFENTLISTNGNYVPFAIALLRELSEAKKIHSEDGVALINAIEVIAKMNKVPKIARMYHLTDEAINVVRNIYQSTHG